MPQKQNSDISNTLTCDVLVIGGGVNGCGIARELSGRGLSVCLAEMGDLASGTSSWSSKLVHGGLRYLEHYAFKLVRESLAERQTLMDMAPHLVHPKRFILPHTPQMRPKWLLRAGLFLYDHLDIFAHKNTSKKLKGARQISLNGTQAGKPLKPEFTSGFEYGDCFVDDTRITILNAMAAAQHGANILTRQKITSCMRSEDSWHAKTDDFDIHAKAVVNATGPWADMLLSQTKLATNRQNIRLVQGSHILVPKIYEHDQPYILQHHDNRIIFAIPYLDEYTLLGTTDKDFDGDPANAKITAAEMLYILEIANSYFEKQLTADDVVASFSGVRPLYDEGQSSAQSASRDYHLAWHQSQKHFLNIFGGKLTTYRTLSIDVAHMVCTELGFDTTKNWKSDSPLPGGDFAGSNCDGSLEEWKQHLASAYPKFDKKLLNRLANAYGKKATQILGTATSAKDLGIDFGYGLSAAEVDYLMQEEWAKTASDVLWRRSKLGYLFGTAQKKKLQNYMRCMQD